MALLPEEFDPARYPRKLNLGCGGDIREGYVNVDMNAWHGPDVLADVRRLDFLPSRHYEEILAQDVLEHLPRNDSLRTLVLWNRPLALGGRLVLRVPSLLAIADVMRRPDHATPEKQEELLQALFGTQAYTGDVHYTSFTEILLRHYLDVAGFRVDSLHLYLGWLFDAVAVKVRHIEVCPLRDFSELQAIAGDEAFVDACYREILRREADSGGREYWLRGLRTGGLVRASLIASMLGGEEYRAIYQGEMAAARGA